MTSSNSRPPLSRPPPPSSASSSRSWPVDVTSNQVAGVTLASVLLLYAAMWGWSKMDDRKKVRRSEILREQLMEEIYASPAGESDKGGAEAGTTVAGGAQLASGTKGKKKKGRTSSTLAPNELAESSSRSRSPSVSGTSRISGGGASLAATSPKRATSPSLPPASSTAPNSASAVAPTRRASVSPAPDALKATPSSSATVSAGGSPSSKTSKLKSASAPSDPVPVSTSSTSSRPPTSSIDAASEGEFELVGPAGRAATKLSKKAAKKAAAAAAGTARQTAKPTSASTASPAAPSSSSAVTTTTEIESGPAAGVTLVVQPPSPRAADSQGVTSSSTAPAAPSSSNPSASSAISSSEWDWDPTTSQTNAVASSSSMSAEAVAEAAALKTAFSSAQTEIEKLQFELAEAHEGRRADGEKTGKEWEKRERDLRLRVVEEERRKWEAWEGERRGRESQLQYQLHHLSLQHASLVHHARAMENVLRQLNDSHATAAPMSSSLLPTPTTSPTATMRRGGGGGRRSPFPNGGGQQRGVGGGNGGPNSNGAFLGVQGGMGLNGAGGQGKEGGGQWGEEVEVDQSVMFTVLKNPPPISADSKPREGSVDSGNSSSHSSNIGVSLDPLLSRSPPELVFASIASYDMNASPIRPPSSNASHHLGGGGPSSYAPSVIGSSSASASSGSSLGSPAGELQALAGEDGGAERGRQQRSVKERDDESKPKGGLVFGTTDKDEDDAHTEEADSTIEEQPDTPLFASILRPPSSQAC